jgi:hypothetical protein
MNAIICPEEPGRWVWIMVWIDEWIDLFEHFAPLPVSLN